MFTLKENETHYIILKDDVEFVRVSKAKNKLEDVKRYFCIQEED